MSDYKVVILDHRYEHYNEENKVLAELGIKPEICFPESEEEAINRLYDADAVICNLYHLSESIINRMEKCRIISRYGVGFDNVDVVAAGRKDIAVCNVPDYAMEDASDHAIALLFALRKKDKLPGQKN